MRARSMFVTAEPLEAHKKTLVRLPILTVITRFSRFYAASAYRCAKMADTGGVSQEEALADFSHLTIALGTPESQTKEGFVEIVESFGCEFQATRARALILAALNQPRSRHLSHPPAVCGAHRRQDEGANPF